jgi:Uncharacterized protein conserved in bacteria (DUF2171)
VSGADPVSWLVVEHGWKVSAADGTALGTVEEVIGDTGNDIFNGLSVTPGLLKRPKYVPAEAVGEIEEGEVRLALTKDQFEALGEYDEPPASAEILPPDRR